MASKKMIDIPFDELNTTELVTLAAFCDIPGASLAVPRELLIEALRTMSPVPGAEAPLDRTRARIHEWINRHWSRVAGSATFARCPNCFKDRACALIEVQEADCPDVQTIFCLIQNGQLG